MKKKIVIVQRTLEFYRVRFYELLKKKCDDNNIELILIYGKDNKANFNDADISWGIKVKNHVVNFLGRNMYYQHIWRYIKNADLIIVEQASKHIVNYILWLLKIFRITRLAFWGHGINFQNENTILSRISEFIKKQISKHVDWFFAYTELSKDLMIKNGFPPERISIINNTIIVEELKNEILKYDIDSLEKIKANLGINSESVCIYIGGLYKEKRLGFLLDALIVAKQTITDLKMIFIGDGPEKDLIYNFAAKHDWIYFIGKKNEQEKVPFLLISKLFLIPSLVGLAIVDTFTFKVPLVTTNHKGHGPEISYLQNGINGIMTENTIDEYAKMIIFLLQHNSEREKLMCGCEISKEKYTMGNMVNNFYIGITNSISKLYI